jgi:shikimate dehydrogenase
MRISAATRTLAIIGWPVGHSRSPAMHNAAFAHLGLDLVYGAYAVPPVRLHPALRGLGALGFLGANITVPHKVAALDGCDQLAASARAAGAVNTLTIDDQGLITGHNTDGDGFIDSLVEETGVAAAGLRVAMLGAGGSARAIAAALVRGGCAQLTVVARDPQRAVAMVEPLDAAMIAQRSCASHETGLLRVSEWTEAALARLLPECDLVVSTTPVGMAGDAAAPPCPVAVELLPSHAVVADVVYSAETELLRAARLAGRRTLGGEGMLLHQGARGFQLWTGRPAPLNVMRAALPQGSPQPVRAATEPLSAPPIPPSEERSP